MNKKILILVMAAILAFSVPVFADEAADSTVAGIKPDSPLYILDRLAEKIQIALLTDAAEEAEALAVIAQERLAESKAMAEENDTEKAVKAISEYKELLEKAVDIVDTAAKDGKAVEKTIDMIVKYDIDDEELLERLMDKVPEEYKEELKKAVEALPVNGKEVQDDSNEKEPAEKVITPGEVLTGKIEDKALLEKIQSAGLNNRQIAALVSLAEQSGKDLGEIVDLFLTNSKGIGKTILELNLAPKAAMKDINKTFKELKREIKAGLVNSEETAKNPEEEDIKVIEEKADEDENSDSIKITKDTEKLEKKILKASEKLEKKVDKAEKKLRIESENTDYDDDDDDKMGKGKSKGKDDKKD